MFVRRIVRVSQKTTDIMRKRVIYFGSIFKLFWKVNAGKRFVLEVARNDVNAAIFYIRGFTCRTVNFLNEIRSP